MTTPTPSDRALQPVPEKRDVVSADELRQRELHFLVEEQAIDMLRDNEDEEATLLDPLTAYEREAARYRAAKPRRRSVL